MTFSTSSSDYKGERSRVSRLAPRRVRSALAWLVLIMLLPTPLPDKGETHGPSSGPRPIEILLTGNGPSDAQLTVEALQAAKIANRLGRVEDGVEALQFLRHEGPYRDAPRPDLILPDLNVPRKDGREVLEELKQGPKLKLIPVVVLTTSRAEQDALRSYAPYANCYITKPVDFTQSVEVVKSIEHFRLAVVTLPGEA